MKLTSSLLSVLLACTPALASARPAKASKQELSQAKTSFVAATAAYDAGRFDEALGGFERAHELSRNPVLFFNLAACAEKLGRTRVAIAYLRAYLSELPHADDADRVRERVGGLDAVAQQEDERKVEEDRRADEDARRRKETEERARVTPIVVAVEQPSVAPASSAARNHAGSIAGLASTAALGIAAAGLGGAALVKYHDLDRICGAAGCGSRVDGVRSQAIAADVLIGVTAVAAVTTTVLFVLERRDHRRGLR